MSIWTKSGWNFPFCRNVSFFAFALDALIVAACFVLSFSGAGVEDRSACPSHRNRSDRCRRSSVSSRKLRLSALVGDTSDGRFITSGVRVALVRSMTIVIRGVRRMCQCVSSSSLRRGLRKNSVAWLFRVGEAHEHTAGRTNHICRWRQHCRILEEQRGGWTEHRPHMLSYCSTVFVTVLSLNISTAIYSSHDFRAVVFVNADCQQRGAVTKPKHVNDDCRALLRPMCSQRSLVLHLSAKYSSRRRLSCSFDKQELRRVLRPLLTSTALFVQGSAVRNFRNPSRTVTDGDKCAAKVHAGAHITELSPPPSLPAPSCRGRP